jgi:hypothetical protein
MTSAHYQLAATRGAGMLAEMTGRLAIGIVLIVSASVAHADPAVDGLSRALPRGWHLTTTPGGELVIRHPAPVRVAGRHLENEPPHTANLPVAAPAGGPEITLALRYRLEPAWSTAQLAAARTSNAKVYADLRDLRARHNLDAIHTSKGRPLPATPDEQSRLAAYQADEAVALARLIRLPRCTLGTSSLFDGPETYAQLDLMVDPPGVMREAYAIVELVNRRCR